MTRFRSTSIRHSVLPFVLAALELRAFILLLACFAACLSSGAIAHEYTRGNLTIAHPWSRPVAAGIPTGVAYFSITNNGPDEEVLLGARTPAAERVEMHRTLVTDGIARMRPLSQIAIAPGERVKIAPGGFHLMLVGLKAPLSVGDDIPLTLLFRNAGEVEVEIKVESRDAAAVAENEPARNMDTVAVAL